MHERNLDRLAIVVLDTFAVYDHQAGRIGTLLALPWLIEHRHADGSWGDGE